jgi:hypothetical protein
LEQPLFTSQKNDIQVAFSLPIMYHKTALEQEIKQVHKTAVQTLRATVGIQANKREVLPQLPFENEVQSLLTDFKHIKKIPFRTNLDGYLHLEDSPGRPEYAFQGDRVFLKGPFIEWNKKASDLRFTLWGNQGFLYRYFLYLLERKHRIFNFHACALYEEANDCLYVIIGGAGSGKTVFLLSGIENGLQVFSTETVHFEIEGADVTWHMGSLVDNVRLGTLIHDFPGFLPENSPTAPEDAWLKKRALDLSQYKARKGTIKNPRAVTILFPRIERGFTETRWYPVRDEQRAVKSLFDNISEKLTDTVLLYDRWPVLGLDEEVTAKRRLQTLYELVRHPSVNQIASLLSNPKSCWERVLK